MAKHGALLKIWCHSYFQKDDELRNTFTCYPQMSQDTWTLNPHICLQAEEAQHNPELEESSSSQQLWVQWCKQLEERKTVANQQYFHKTVIPWMGPGYSMLYIIWCPHSMEDKDFLNCQRAVLTSSWALLNLHTGKGCGWTPHFQGL